MKTKTEKAAIRCWRVVCVYSHFSLLQTEVFMTFEGAELFAKQWVTENGIHCIILETIAIVEPENKHREIENHYQTSFGV